ncbi:hypothetical protein SERLADRAFT_480454, partial [Serpula lacrymans var. lacrymans S7.9]
MLLAAALDDRGFFSQDENSFKACFSSKLGAFRAIEEALELHKIDFLVALSSISTFGNAGQTNYASANTVLDGQVRKYSNAFSIVTPAISDSATMIGKSDSSVNATRFEHLIPWGYSAKELCDCIKDGLLKMADGPVGLYIPDLDWNLVNQYMGPS